MKWILVAIVLAQLAVDASPINATQQDDDFDTVDYISPKNYTILPHLAGRIDQNTVDFINSSDDDDTRKVLIYQYAYAGKHDVTKYLAPWDSPKYTIYISRGAFMSTTGPSNIEIPASVLYIGGNAFADSTIRTVMFLSNDTVIHSTAFDRLDTITMICPTYNISQHCNDNWYDVYTALSACLTHLELSTGARIGKLR